MTGRLPPLYATPASTSVARVLALLCWTCAAFGLLQAGSYVFLGHPRAFPADFNCFWAAGVSWASGESPYSEFYRDILTRGDNLHLHDIPPPFFYPPNTAVLFAPLGLLPLKDASFIWSLINLTALAAASRLAGRLSPPVLGLSSASLGALHFGVVGGALAMSEVILAHNIISFVLYLGFVMLLSGLHRGRPRDVFLGLTICLMKPTLGVPLVAALLLSRRTRPAALASGAMTALLALGGTLAVGGPETILLFLENLAAYKLYPENSFPNVSGAGFLLHHFAGGGLGSFAGLAVCVSALVIYRLTGTRPDACAAIFAMVGALFFMPSHNHDYLPLVAAGLLQLHWDRASGFIMLGAAGASGSAWILAELLEKSGAGYLAYNTAAIDSLAAAAAFSALIFAAFRSRARTEALFAS